jgi:4-methyl-5(b-hydroxyethyl)-thiazole monophosphate biosynthesis
MKKKVLVLLADGFEEMEAVAPIDILRRADVEVTVAGLGKLEATGAHGLAFKTDIQLEDYQGVPDAVVLPGGMPGAANLKKSPHVKALIDRVLANKKIVGAICASPAVVLASQGILDGKKATCFPGYEKDLGAQVKFSADRVVTDGLIVTSRAPGTAAEFAFELVTRLVDKATADKIGQTMLVKA